MWLDFGHACLVGDLIAEIESTSEHLIASHLLDNLGSADEHLVPGDGRINWPAAMLNDAEDRLRGNTNARSGEQDRLVQGSPALGQRTR